MRIENVGNAQLERLTDEFTETITYRKPVDYVEDTRYLSDGITSNPGPFSFDVTPYFREPLSRLDPRDPAREVNVRKGIQVAYTTAFLENGVLYVSGHLKSVSAAYVTVDDDLTNIRIENNILPMLQEAEVKIRSADTKSSKKTGKTKNFIQWEGGGFLLPLGAQSPGKMRQSSVLYMFKDEISGWPQIVKRSNDKGDPDSLTDDRCKGFWVRRKIIRGSSPGVKGACRITTQYERGDERKYHVRCVRCGFPQEIRWSGHNKDTGKDYGFAWDMEHGGLILESVRYHCFNCHKGHYEHDKIELLAEESGAEWVATSRPVEPYIYSYDVPAFLSPTGARPWSDCVSLYLQAYNPEEKKVINISKYRAFYNGVLGRAFEEMGDKIPFKAVSRHRRHEYSLGQIPNKFAVQYAGGPVSFITLTVDVHKHFIQAAVIGWTRGMRCFLLEYNAFRDDSETGCEEIKSPAWDEVRKLIEEWECTADDGNEYRIDLSFVDSQWKFNTVVKFCSEYNTSVYPIRGVGGQQAAKQKVNEFKGDKTKSGLETFAINVDYYKDRLETVLQRRWVPESGTQEEHHFNAPINLLDKALGELTVEYRREEIDKKTGEVRYVWYRPGNARNELWDLLVYGHAAVEIAAWYQQIKVEERDEVDWADFWDACEGQW